MTIETTAYKLLSASTELNNLMDKLRARSLVLDSNKAFSPLKSQKGLQILLVKN